MGLAREILLFFWGKLGFENKKFRADVVDAAVDDIVEVVRGGGEGIEGGGGARTEACQF